MLSISFIMGKDVNCVPLLLNCLLVVLITVLIDAEIKLLPQAQRGANQSQGRWMKDYRGKHMEMVLL